MRDAHCSFFVFFCKRTKNDLTERKKEYIYMPKHKNREASKIKTRIQEQVELYFNTVFDEDLRGGVIELAPQGYFHYTYHGNRAKSINTASRLLQKYPKNSVFASLSAFRAGNTNTQSVRSNANLWRTGAIMIDIDGNAELCGREDEVIAVLRWAWEHEKIPEPNLYSYTGGGGVHLYYAIESMPAKMASSVQALQLAIIAAIVPFEKDFPYNSKGGYRVDTRVVDTQRMDRVPGSINPKTGNRCICFPARREKYTYHQLLEAVSPDTKWRASIQSRIFKDDIARERGEKKKTACLNRPVSTPQKSQTYTTKSKTIAKNRIKFLFRLAEANHDFQGCRESACFLLQNWAKQAQLSPAKTAELLNRLNGFFPSPLSTRELHETSRAGKVYLFTNDTVAEMLHLSADERKIMTQKHRPGNRKQKTILAKMTIAKLCLDGLNTAQIAQKTGYSESIVKRRRTEMKKGDGLMFWADYWRQTARKAKEKLQKNTSFLFSQKSSFCPYIISSLIEFLEQLEPSKAVFSPPQPFPKPLFDKGVL